MVAEANALALQHCPTVLVNSKGRLHNRSRTDSKKYKRAKQARKAAAQWAAAADAEAAVTVLATDKAAHARKLIVDYQDAHPDATREATAAAVRKTLQRQLQQINREHMTHAAKIERHRQQTFADKNQKLANKRATGMYVKPVSQALRVLEDVRDNNNIVTGPRCKEVTQSYVTARASAHGHACHATAPCTSTTTTEPFPFAMPSATDGFTLENPQPTTRSLHHIIQDTCTFTQCLNSLANNKCPGPDGIANEILKALPDECKQAIHLLFQIMWATGVTPKAWKCSTTIMLYKHKGRVTNLRYYRRIGLENTIYKLWTRMVTLAMTDYGERNAVHSHSQAGFRSKRSTHEQVENLVMALEDAMLEKQDIHLLQVDFSEAFDTVDHQKITHVLLALGFPVDAVRVVTNLYTDASTVVRTPYGDTDRSPYNEEPYKGTACHHTCSYCTWSPSSGG
eukprot:GHRQ01014673.1.p1 GENE.GHRQ01014673.1~~GHRQ01014673.1.p1  ORF type:complete len:453 (-),score=51.05 GHRQ01014673.1:440-1798(-)